MKKIILSVTNNLESDQRVNKVATSLFNHGYDVTVMGVRSRPCHDYTQPYHTRRLHVFFKKGPLFYAEANIRFLFALLFSKADIFLANDTDSVLANYLASKIRRKQLAVDLHELFPEVPEVVNRPKVKRFWTKIEDIVFPHITKGYTVCQSIADYYRKRYNISLSVVRNIPNKRAYQGRTNKLNYGGKKIILYQGAVNVGRGIEWVIDAMPMIDNAVFVVIGKGDLYDDLRQKTEQMRLTDKVIFLGHIPFAELSEYTRSADLGLCLLKNQGLSYYYSLPNRVFDYMQNHVPLLATNFPEIANVLGTYGTGKLIDHYEPEYLVQTIQQMLAQPIDHPTFEKACEAFNWENEEKVLMGIIE